jgi:Fe-S-cluster containining protein
MSWEDEMNELTAQLEKEEQTSEELTRLRQALARLYEVLTARGVIGPDHPRLIERYAASKAKPRVHLAMIDDKRSVKNADVDCISLLHICGARCCTMKVELSEEDLRENRFQFQTQQPYLLAKSEDGHCIYLGEHGCGQYHDRPAMCRMYDCRTDKRIWIDFEKKIPQSPHRLWIDDIRSYPAPEE